MKQPTQKQIKALRKRYNELIAEAQAKCITDFQEVRKYVFSKLADLKKDDKLYKILQSYIIEHYNEMFLNLKTSVVDNYNTAGVIEIGFASKTLGEKLAYIPAQVKILPKTKPFEITNRILAEKSVLKRSKIMAQQVTSTIAKSFEKGSSIQEVQKKIDVIMGFRNKYGQINDKAKKLIIEGKFSHRNGHIYETYRIARTETMRMASLRTHEVFNAVERDDKRLKLWAVLDHRTRPQSAVMHRQISDEKGRFRYPDGIFYELGEAPKQWSINDRETQFVVFLDNPTIAKELKQQEKAKLPNLQTLYEQTQGVATALRNSMPESQITTEYLRDNFDKELRKHYVVVGKLDTNVQQMLGSNTKDLRLSFDNFVKNQAKHPEIAYEMYKRANTYINQSQNIFKKNNQIISFVEQNNTLYQMVIKTTQNKDENYLQSIRVSNYTDLERYKKQ